MYTTPQDPGDHGSYRWIRVGDITEGEVDGCVTELQRLLNSHGPGLAVDGNFGPATVAAVKSFQSSHGLGRRWHGGSEHEGRT